MDDAKIPVIIPSYEPDEKLIALLHRLKESGMEQVVIVDDGSEGERYQQIFQNAKKEFGYTVLHHAVNLGKGRALKTAFNYCLLHYPDAIGCVTIDSDGQHTVKDMLACMNALKNQPDALILGVRDFNQKGIPVRSVFGNKCTGKVMKLLTGIGVSDTQTGLRAIPRSFMKKLLGEKGERFEFETNMLLDTKNENIRIVEIPIETIYIEENKTSHFHPLKDSLRIYTVFLKFIFSSLSSSVVDILLFAFFCSLLKGKTFGLVGYVFAATVAARVLSAAYNFSINYKIVFHGAGNTGKAILRYVLLAVCIMAASGFLVEHIQASLGIAEVLVKIPVDILLFLVSFLVQREFVYK
ncbi:MAG: glycosyltransferase [Lachnospiraceae bacterium]